MLKIQLSPSRGPMEPDRRPWIVRALLNVGVGLLLVAAIVAPLLLTIGAIWFVVNGGAWLRWLICAPVALVMLGWVGRELRRGLR